MNACLALILTSLLGAAVAQPATAPAEPQPPFVNRYPHPPGASFLAWQWERLRDGLPKPAPEGGWNLPAMLTDPATLRVPGNNPSVTWIGHATMLVRLAGQAMLFDPVFSTHASPLGFIGPRRAVPLPIALVDLPHIDLVMISHNHYDHLDADTVQRLAAQPGGSPRFLVPLGLKAWFADLGIHRVDEYAWWQTTREGTLDIHFVPVQHWSKRSLADRNQTLWGGWVVEGEGLRLIHTGDTGYSADFSDIGARLGPFDMAFIPIGAYAPRWFMKVMHVDVPEAVQVRADLRAERAIGMHWGTFEGLTDEPLDEPPRILARQRSEHGLLPAQFDVMKIGETRRLQKVRPR
jgi:N-acyl-phosphatidylethanolamine-hydrolysing phospholipase D